MNGTNYEVSHCGVFTSPHPHPYWAQIFTLESCFQILLACVSPVIPPQPQNTTIDIIVLYSLILNFLEEKSR